MRRKLLAGLVLSLCALPAAAQADLAVHRARPATGAGRSCTRPPATAPQLTNTRKRVARAPDPRLRRERLPRRRVPLPGLPLRRPRRRASSPTPATRASSANTFSKPNGTYTYPTDPAYANNAADLVELRVKPLPDATAFRLTLNTMKDPSLVAFSIAIGGTRASRCRSRTARTCAPRPTCS